MKRFFKMLLFVIVALPIDSIGSVAQNGGIIFRGIIQDSSFLKNEKINVEVLESGEALQTTVGEPFQIELPNDTLWNICITNSDTAGAEKEKCFELEYHGKDSLFTKTIGDAFVNDSNKNATEENPNDSIETVLRDSTSEPKDTLQKNENSIDVDKILAEGTSTKITELKKVVVQLRRRPKRKPGESVVSAKSIKRMPGLAEADVIRSIQALPGVVASSDFSTKIYVRGGASDQNLFLFDNAVVYSPSHFFGLFSTFLVEGIDDVQFYKSGFPAQYGNRLSSVLKMEGRAGGEDSVEEWFSKSSLKVSIFAAQLHTEGHKGNARWVLAGRTTYIGYMLDLLNALNVIDLDLDYEFTDLQGTFLYNFTEDTKLKFSFYVGKDVLTFDPLYIDWGNIAIPINLTHRINGSWEYNSTFAFSQFYQNMELSDLISIGMYLYTFVGKQWINYRGIQNHTLTFGYELEYDYVRFWEKIASLKATDIQEPLHHTAYVQDSWKLNPDLTFQYGMRFNYQSASEHFGIEPRASLNLWLDETKELEFYGGYYLQYMNSIMFSDREALNEFYYPATTTVNGRQIKPSSSFLFAFDYKQKDVLDGYDLIAGVYYKTQNNLNTFTMDTDSTEETSSEDFMMADYFGTAKGYSFGYELSFRKDKGWWFGGINFSQSLSVLRADDGTKAYFPSWHQPYALKMDLGLNWKGDDEALFYYDKKTGRYLRSSIVLKYSSGMPITDYKGYFYNEELGGNALEDEITVIASSRNSGRQTDYFRIDVKAIDVGRENKWNFSWTLINVTNHENMFYTFYDTKKNPPEKNSITQFPFLPVMFSYEYYF